MSLVRVAVIALAVLGAAALGGWRVAGAMAPTPDSRTVVAGGVQYRVTNVREIKGLNDRDLGGMSHGVQGLVSTGSALVQVDLTVLGGDSTAAYNTGRLEIATGGKSGVRPVGGTLGRGTVGAHGKVDGTLSFVLPRDGARLRLRVRNDSRSIPLIRIARETAAPSDHSHEDTPATGSSTDPPAGDLEGSSADQHDDSAAAPDPTDDAPAVGPPAGGGP